MSKPNTAPDDRLAEIARLLEIRSCLAGALLPKDVLDGLDTMTMRRLRELVEPGR